MRVSNKLFNEQQVRAFNTLRSDMQGIQEKISSGNKINRASDDPMGAVNLSAAKDQKPRLSNMLRIQMLRLCAWISAIKRLMK
jgi:flagellin-like hook-associated protein FlgL